MSVSRGIGSGTKLAYYFCVRWKNGDEHTFELSQTNWGKLNYSLMTYKSLSGWITFNQVDKSFVRISLDDLSGIRFFTRPKSNPLNDPRHYEDPLN